MKMILYRNAVSSELSGKYPLFIRRYKAMIINLMVILISAQFFYHPAAAAAPAAPQLKAGVAKVNITNLDVGGLVRDSVYARTLVLDDGKTRAAIIAVDILIVGSFLETVRAELQKDPGIDPKHILINASQLHTARAVCADIDKRLVKAVREAWKNRVPVTAGTGTGYEDRIMENRRLKLKNGKEWTIRHAYPLPPDAEVAGIGPVDPEIGILRLDRKDGRTLAVVYNFACHPFQDSRQNKFGWQELGTTADYPGYACRVIENNLSEGTIALFLQGCDGDIATVVYKDVNNPRDAEPLGNMLGLSTLKAARPIQCKAAGELKIINETIDLPRRKDIPDRLAALQDEQEKLLESLRGTSLNAKTFIPLYIKYSLTEDYPSYYSHRYIREEMMGKNDLKGLDDENRRNMEKYLENMYVMEKLTRIRENMALLKRRQAENETAAWKPIKAEVFGLRIGDFVLVTFPGEASVEIGLNIKKLSPHKNTFVLAHTNSNATNYLYAPTVQQYKGEDYEDTNTSLAPEWQKIYEDKVMEILNKL